jgi:CrcB protein
LGHRAASYVRTTNRVEDESMRYLAVAVGAVLGANLRFMVTNWTIDNWGTGFPYGTFIINVTGTLVIGAFLAFLVGRAPINPLWRLFFVTGFLGGYTTFSSYAWEALSLGEEGAWRSFVLYVGGSNVLGLIGVWLGATLARLMP